MDFIEENVFLEEYMKVIFSVMNELWKKKELCDVVFYVGDLEIYVYKVVLVLFSLYFYVMFMSDVLESC